MGFVSIKRPAVYNSDSNSYLSRYTVINPETGALEVRTQILEDTEVKAITNNIQASLSVKIKDLSDQISSNSLTFDLEEDFKSESLAVYYNGLMISKDIESKTSDTFTINNDYSSIIISGDTLFASYVPGSD